MTRYQTIKNWTREHQPTITAAAITTAAVAVYGGLVYIAIKQEEEATKQRQQLGAWTIEQNKAGKSVFQLADGSHIAVAMD